MNSIQTFHKSQKGSDPLEAIPALTFFRCLAGEGLTPFGIGSKLIAALVFGTLLSAALIGQESTATKLDSSAKKTIDAQQALEAATRQSVARQEYELRYKMQPDRQYRWDVEQVLSKKTRIANKYEELSARAQSTHRWQVVNVDSLGHMTFEQVIEKASSWSQQGEEPPIAYDSNSTDDPPPGFELIHKYLGRPIKTVTITPTGEVTRKQLAFEQTRLGLGEITIPLPAKPVTIGTKWHVNRELTGKDEDHQFRKVTTRLVYELKSVSDGKAYLSFRTEVLTPISSEKLKSQLMQNMIRGYIIFDLELGNIVFRETVWDEKAQAYEGPESFLHYVAKLTETWVPEQQTVNTLAPVAPAVSVKIKTRGSQPVMRR
jgi:hypothetical protein